MPAVLKVDPRRRIVLSGFYGNVTAQDILRHQAVILADPHFRPDFADVVDLSSASGAFVDESALAALAGTKSIFDPDVPHVIVVLADLMWEVAVKYRDLVRETRPNLHVVRTLTEARELLDKLGYRFMPE
jgi:hypothetical protein